MFIEGLVQFAADGSVLPGLALSWEVSGDALTYVFHLKSGVRFHDGSAFDAAAAKFRCSASWRPVRPIRKERGCGRYVQSKQSIH